MNKREQQRFTEEMEVRATDKTNEAPFLTVTTSIIGGNGEIFG